MNDIRSDSGFNMDQHCTYLNQDGMDDYSFSHTAAYCGKPQPRRCGCAFCYHETPVETDEFSDEFVTEVFYALRRKNVSVLYSEVKEALNSCKDVLD